MVGVSYIQRVALRGGVAPAAPFTPQNLGEREIVDYQGDYNFWKAACAGLAACLGALTDDAAPAATGAGGGRGPIPSRLGTCAEPMTGSECESFSDVPERRVQRRPI